MPHEENKIGDDDARNHEIQRLKVNIEVAKKRRYRQRVRGGSYLIIFTRKNDSHWECLLQSQLAMFGLSDQSSSHHKSRQISADSLLVPVPVPSSQQPPPALLPSSSSTRPSPSVSIAESQPRCDSRYYSRGDRTIFIAGPVFKSAFPICILSCLRRRRRCRAFELCCTILCLTFTLLTPLSAY